MVVVRPSTSYSGFLHLVPLLQVWILGLRILTSRSQYATGSIRIIFSYARVYRDGNAYAGYAVEESAKGSAAPQKQEGCRRESDGAGAVSQSAYTELLVVSSILLVCFNQSDYVDMHVHMVNTLCIDVGSLYYC